MFETALHRRVALAVALAALALSGAVAGTPVSTADVSETDASSVGAGAPALSNDDAGPDANATVYHDGQELVVPPAPSVTISGETTVEPGTELTILVESQNGSVSEPEQVNVSEDGTYRATFDLARFGFGTELDVVVQKNGTVVARETEARVMNRSTFRNATVTVGASDDDPLVLRSAPNQPVRVESDAPAGTETTVRIRSTRHNLLVTRQATVGEDGTGTATFDLSDVAPGTTFTATVGADAETEVDGVVVNESAAIRRDAAFAVADPAANYTVRGRVMDAAVSKLDVGVASEDGSLESRTVTVREDGTFRTTFDLSSVPAGTEVAVEVGGLPRSVTPVVATDEGRPPTVYAFVETPPNATIRYPAETILVHPASNQTVRATTNLRPGTELTVEAVNDELNSPRNFERTANVTVRDDGSFVATLDFGGVEPGTNFTVRVGSGLAYAEGRVVNDSVALPTVATTRPTTVNESGFPFTTTAIADGPTTTGDDATPEDASAGHAELVDVPGFGVPVALAALLAALALARRG